MSRRHDDADAEMRRERCRPNQNFSSFKITRIDFSHAHGRG